MVGAVVVVGAIIVVDAVVVVDVIIVVDAVVLLGAALSSLRPVLIAAANAVLIVIAWVD